ncbi:MAG: LytTR family DNA-binding domain-containing protein [Bacteroidota bacterium]
MFQQLVQRLNQPFPTRANFGEEVKGSFAVSVFVFLFLYLLRPFGLEFYKGNLLTVSLGFGVVSLIVSILYDGTARFLLGIRKDHEGWVLKKWLVYVIGLILSVALGNYLYVCWMSDWFGFHLETMLRMLFNTFAIGIFPLIFLGFYLQLRAIQRHEGVAQSLQALEPTVSADELFVLKTKSGQSLSIRVSQLRYVEAQQNYVSLVLFDGEEKKQRWRQPMAEVARQLETVGLIRCHRSFLVHPGYVEEVTGNAQGLKLKLQHIHTWIPVSRSYVNQVREQLHAYRAE